MTKNQNLALLLGLGAFISLSGANANASVIDLKNLDSDGREVNVVIEPGDGTILPSKRAIKIVLDKYEEEKIEVRKSLFKKETFSVIGSVTMPSTGNKCSSLLIDTDYEIVFTKSKGGGIECAAKVMQ